MKKTISIVLMLLIVCSILVFPVSADTVTQVNIGGKTYTLNVGDVFHYSFYVNSGSVLGHKGIATCQIQTLYSDSLEFVETYLVDEDGEYRDYEAYLYPSVRRGVVSNKLPGMLLMNFVDSSARTYMDSSNFILCRAKFKVVKSDLDASVATHIVKLETLDSNKDAVPIILGDEVQNGYNATTKVVVETNPFIVGDVNNNGRLDISDGTLIQLYLLDIRTITNVPIADADRDYNITITDTTYIQKKLAGIRHSKEIVGEYDFPDYYNYRSN